MPCDSGLKTGDSGGDDTAQSTPKREQKAWPPACPDGPQKPYVLAAMQEAGPDDALFRLTDVTTLEDHEVLDVECTPYTGGPWSPDHQHGGAVAALLSFALDRMPSPGPMRLARITLDMFRGVPLTPLRVETRITRGGRRIQALDTTLFAAETPVARASGLRVRTDDTLEELDAPLPIAPELGAPPATVPEFGIRDGIGHIPGFAYACEIMVERAEACGIPATTWARLRCPVVEGHPASAVVKMAAIVDFASGTGNAMDYERFTSINPDLSIHVIREPRSDWIGLRGRTSRAADGIGQSDAGVYDVEGLVGRASATLLLDRR